MMTVKTADGKVREVNKSYGARLIEQGKAIAFKKRAAKKEAAKGEA